MTRHNFFFLIALLCIKILMKEGITMDLFLPMKNLLCEAFSFKRYKALPLPLAILVGIVLLPVWIAGLVIVGCYYLASLFLALVNYPVDALLRFVRNEAKEVNEITQVFVYIIGFPVVVLFKVFAVLFTLFNYVLFFFATIYLWIATLCALKFDISMKGIERSLEAEEKSHSATIKAIVFLLINAIGLLVAFVGLIFLILGLVGVLPLAIALILFMVTGGFYALSILWLVIAFGTKLMNFKPRPKKEKPQKVEEPAEEEPVEEVQEEEEKAEQPVQEESPVEEEQPQEETPEEERHEEENFDEQPQEEEYREEVVDNPSEDEPIEEKHFDFSSLEEYQKNRRPSDDYQAERLDDLEDDYDRR